MNRTDRCLERQIGALGVVALELQHVRHEIVVGVELLARATIHWSSDGWRTSRDTPTRDSGFGIHFADLDTAGLAAGGGIVFTIHWTAAERWEGVGIDGINFMLNALEEVPQADVVDSLRLFAAEVMPKFRS